MMLGHFREMAINSAINAIAGIIISNQEGLAAK
jgi:hypothetical protein